MQAKMRQLTPEATFLHTAKRHTWIAGAIAIDKHAAAFKTRRKVIGKMSIRSE
ncbi:hypothetical protein D3C81_2222090 [compost metagenome]